MAENSPSNIQGQNKNIKNGRKFSKSGHASFVRVARPTPAGGRRAAQFPPPAGPPTRCASSSVKSTAAGEALHPVGGRIGDAIAHAFGNARCTCRARTRLRRRGCGFRTSHTCTSTRHPVAFVRACAQGLWGVRARWEGGGNARSRRRSTARPPHLVHGRVDVAHDRAHAPVAAAGQCVPARGRLRPDRQHTLRKPTRHAMSVAAQDGVPSGFADIGADPSRGRTRQCPRQSRGHPPQTANGSGSRAPPPTSRGRRRSWRRYSPHSGRFPRHSFGNPGRRVGRAHRGRPKTTLPVAHITSSATVWVRVSARGAWSGGGRAWRAHPFKNGHAMAPMPRAPNAAIRRAGVVFRRFKAPDPVARTERHAPGDARVCVGPCVRRQRGATAAHADRVHASGRFKRSRRKAGEKSTKPKWSSTFQHALPPSAPAAKRPRGSGARTRVQSV